MLIPECPDCACLMVKMFIETTSHTGWQGGWACGCYKEDYERVPETTQYIKFHNSKPTTLGVAINEMLKHKEQ